METAESAVKQKNRLGRADQENQAHKQSFLIRPKIYIETNAIEICFLDAKILIDIETNDLFAGRKGKLEKIEYYGLEANYAERFEKKENVRRPKARIWEAHFEKFVAVVDASVSDQRLFFLIFREKDYCAFRGKAFFRASYFCNSFAKKKQFFVNDLSATVKEWPFSSIKPKKEKITLKKWN